MTTIDLFCTKQLNNNEEGGIFEIQKKNHEKKRKHLIYFQNYYIIYRSLLQMLQTDNLEIPTISYDADIEDCPAYLSKNQNKKCSLSYNSILFTQNSNKRNQFLQKIPPTKRNNPPLKKLLKKTKITNLVKNYCNKVKRNNPYQDPVEFKLVIDAKKSYLRQFFESQEGYEMSISQITILTITNILIILVLTVFYTLCLIFPQVEDNKILTFVQVLGLIFYLIEMIFNFIAKKYQEGREMIYIKQISLNYLKGKFFIDLLSLVILCVDISNPSYNIIIKIFRLIIMLKLSQSLDKMEIIQNIYITTFYRQQYWGLFNVFLINFSFAHILSILLNAIALLDNNNWLAVHNLHHSPWYQKYVWGYYWGTTTMLTVGYGDFVATNYKEAICLIFIQMFSCITLAYTINCVGNLISNIRQQRNQKNKNLKIFHQMSKKNKIDYELENRINNYIEQSYQIKKEFNFDEQDNLLSYLPASLKTQYLNSANIKIFKEISFLKDLTLRTQAMLSQKVIRLITHPEQVIQKKDEHCKMILLNQGKVGMSIRNMNNSSGKTVIVETIQVKDDQNSKLLSLGFLRSKFLEFDIKSLSYSILFYIQKEDLINILKLSSIDYQHFCVMRDRSQYYLNDDEIYKCDFCPLQYHSKFKCPKIHFMPIKQHVNNKYLFKLNTVKQARFSNVNRKYQSKRKFLKQVHNIQNLMDQFRSEIGEDLTQYVQDQKSHIYSKVLIQQINTHTEIIIQKDMSKNKNSLALMSPQEIVNMFQAMNSSKQIQFWTVQSDLLCDWKYYFPSFNAKELRKRKYKRRSEKN